MIESDDAGFPDELKHPRRPPIVELSGDENEPQPLNRLGLTKEGSTSERRDRNGKRYLDWDLEDQAGKPIEEVRPIVEEIDQERQ